MLTMAENYEQRTDEREPVGCPTPGACSCPTNHAPALLEALKELVQADDAVVAIWSQDRNFGQREALLASNDAYRRRAISKARTALTQATGRDLEGGGR